MFSSKKFPFTRQMLEFAPEFAGVYILWDESEPIYIGRAVVNGSIKTALLAHQDGVHGQCTMRATHYSFEINIWPSSRESELLAEFSKTYGRDPRCQQQIVNAKR